MQKRPLSLTIVAVLITILTLLGIVGVVMAGTPTMAKTMEQMHISIAMYRALGGLGVVVGIACVYGILKGLPWSRVLYLVWGIINLPVTFYISPMKASVVVSLIILVVVCAFLWTNAANDWFSARGLMLKRERS